jgi:hypothetical protein
LADTIGAQSPTAYLNETHRQVRQAHRERPDQHVPHGEDKRKAAEASELPRGQAIRKAEEAAGREPYRPNSQQAQVLAQEIAAQAAARDKKTAERRGRLTRREGPYKSRQAPERPATVSDAPVKLTV